MSFLSRLWRFIRRPTGYVGKDLEGNYYYEYPGHTGDFRRRRRVVKYRGKSDNYDIAVSGKRIAVQWEAWLSHTRRHPPTLEELRADLERRQILAERVRMIEAREQEERERMLAKAQVQEAVEAPTVTNSASTPSMPEASEQQNARRMDEVHQTSPRDEKGRPHAAMPNADVDQPVPWTPKVARRG